MVHRRRVFFQWRRAVGSAEPSNLDSFTAARSAAASASGAGMALLPWLAATTRTGTRSVELVRDQAWAGGEIE